MHGDLSVLMQQLLSQELPLEWGLAQYTWFLEHVLEMNPLFLPAVVMWEMVHIPTVHITSMLEFFVPLHVSDVYHSGTDINTVDIMTLH